IIALGLLVRVVGLAGGVAVLLGSSTPTAATAAAPTPAAAPGSACFLAGGRAHVLGLGGEVFGVLCDADVGSGRCFARQRRLEQHRRRRGRMVCLLGGHSLDACHGGDRVARGVL